MPKLIYNNQVYDFRQLPAHGFPDEPALHQVSGIIKAWNSGQPYFKLSTSGTTGHPGRKVFSREQLVLSAKQTISAFNLNREDILFLCLSTEHVAGFMMVIRALAGQMDLMVEPASGLPLNVKPATPPSFASFVPQQIFNLLQLTTSGLESLNKMKAILVGGGVISSKLEALIQKVNTPVYHTYGMTETLTHVATRRINGNNSPNA